MMVTKIENWLIAETNFGKIFAILAKKYENLEKDA